jgi:hypothetical protein
MTWNHHSQECCEDSNPPTSGFAEATFMVFREQNVPPGDQLRRLKQLMQVTANQLPPGDRLLIQKRIQELERQLTKT